MFSRDFVFWVQNQVALLISWKPTGKNPISNVPVLRKYKIIKIPDPSRQKRNALLFRKFSISAQFHGMKIQNIKSIVGNLASKVIFWIDCRQSEQYFQLSSRVLAGVLPPAGQIFEKWRPLENIEGFPPLFCVFFKQGVSRGAASGGSDFWKMAPHWFVCYVFDMFCDFQAVV